jgi:hypothetical protein
VNSSNDIDGFRLYRADAMRNMPPLDSGDCCGEECECAPVTRDLDALIHPPLVQGGQGRTDEDTNREASKLLVVLLAIVAIALACVIAYLRGRWA